MQILEFIEVNGMFSLYRLLFPTKWSYFVYFIINSWVVVIGRSCKLWIFFAIQIEEFFMWAKLRIYDLKVLILYLQLYKIPRHCYEKKS